MKATVLFARTKEFEEFKQEHEIGEQKLKALEKVLNIRLQRAVKTFSDDDIRAMWEEIKICREHLYDVSGRYEIYFETDYQLPIMNIYMSIVLVDARILLSEDFDDWDDIYFEPPYLACLFEMDDDKKILISHGAREDFTDDDTVEAII